jgi:extradiol dioxygenase family protein
MNNINSFHYSFKVRDIALTRKFYIEILGCTEGRFTETWIDFNFFGNQLSAHISDEFPKLDYCGKVDGVNVPIPHFGCLLELSKFEETQRKLEIANIEFLIKPQKRYEGKIGEQLTMFIFDFSGNPIEFKSFLNIEEVFLK